MPTLRIAADVCRRIHGRRRERAQDEGFFQLLFGIFGGEKAAKIGWGGSVQRGMAALGVEDDSFGVRDGDVEVAVE